MEGRGRRSGASLSVIAGGGALERVDPPADLTPAQAEIWRETVAALPADWWNGSNARLLSGYVRALDMSNALSLQIEALIGGGDSAEIALALKNLLDMRDKEDRRALSFATKMRLTQQSSYTDKSSNTAKRRTSKALWHRDES